MDYAIIKKILLDCLKIDSQTYPHAPVLTVAHDNDRSLSYKGKYYSPLINTMEDDLAKLDIHCISVARIISTIKGELSHGRVFSPEGQFARSLVKKRLKGIFFRGRYPFSASEERIWADILDKTGARMVFGIQPSRELCVACHKRGIWVADVQHGVIADTHPWYGQAFRSSDPVEYLPSAFLCWDHGSNEVIDKWARNKGVKTHVIGNRWLARFLKRENDDHLVRELCEVYERDNPSDLTKKTILVSLSWGDTNIENKFITAGLEKTIKSTSNRFRWILRLHPNQVKGFASDEGPKFIEYFNAHLSEHATWEAATRAPLPAVLQSVDLHISWNSSVSIEASQIGIKTALLDPRLRDPNQRADYYGYYRKMGLIDLIPETADQISNWIEQNLDSKKNIESYRGFDIEYENLLKFIAVS
jgi:hypothetical protein